MIPHPGDPPDDVPPMVGGERPYDLVVWGASGFVGRLVVEHLFERYPPGGPLRWAVAGRNREKLETLLNGLAGASAGASVGGQPPILIAESHDRESLARLAGATKVVLTTVGPYARYGSELVEACVSSGSDYCDLCAEVEWIRTMIDKHQTEAQKSGARIVMGCGFDSIPSDIGTFYLQKLALAECGRPCNEIALLVRAIKGGVSGGTMASLLNSMGQVREEGAAARVLKDPYGLNPEGERGGPDGPDQTGSRFDPDAGEWTAPFVMAPVNTKVVRRTNALLGYPYGRDFRYREAMLRGRGVPGRCKAAIVSAGHRVLMFASSNRFMRRIVLQLGPKPGEGPSRQKIENGYFDMLLIGKQPDGKMLRMRVTGDRDPGYGSTSKMLAESAICLACDVPETTGGFWTPASAMGSALQARLVANAGMRFELE